MPAVTLPISFDFCSSATYVTHASPNIAIEIPWTYGTQHADYGYTAPGMQAADRDSGVTNKSLASIHFAQPNDEYFWRVDLPSAGSYRFRLAAGDAAFNQSAYLFYIAIFDDTTLLHVVLNDVTGPTAGNFYDASGVIRSAANWTADNVALDLTFATAILKVQMGKIANAGYTMWAHLLIEDAGNVGSSAGSATVSGVGAYSTTSTRRSIFSSPIFRG